MVKYLLNNYVEKDQTDLLGLSALDYARQAGHKDVVEILETQNGGKSTPKEE